MTRHHSAAQTYRNPTTYKTARRAAGDPAWFVVWTNPRCERRAALALKAKGYETFLPMRARWVKQFRRIARAEFPLFPRYVFVALKPGQSFPGIRGASGVEAILRNEDIPVEVPAEAVEELQRVCAAGVFDETLRVSTASLVTPGMPVRVKDGPFVSFEGVVHRVLSSKTVEVLVSIFGRQSPVHMPLEAVEPAC